MKVKSKSEVAQSCPTLSDPRDCSHLAPQSMGFPRQEYWSGGPLLLRGVASVLRKRKTQEHVSSVVTPGKDACVEEWNSA